MKKSMLFAIFICAAGFTFAQSAKYESAMKANISQLDSVMQKNNFDELANNFTRIGDAEKTQWLPYYYAAYTYALAGLRQEDNSKKDGLADKATDQIKKAESILGKENSETDVIKSMIASVHMTVDPQTRYMTYLSPINENIEKAKSLDPTNPRPYILEAENKFYTPAAYGGGKDVTKPILDKANQMMQDFKPETDLSPNWGKTTLEYFLSQYK